MNRFLKLASVVKSFLVPRSLLVASTIACAFTGSQANAHWPHGHHWGGSSFGFGPSFGYSGWGGTWGAYGMGGGFRHTSFYSPIRSVGFGFPIHRSFHSGFHSNFGISPVFLNPVVCRPIVYRPVFCAPIYYQPIQYCPPPVVPVFYQTGFPVCATTPRLSVPTTSGQGSMLQVSNTRQSLQVASSAPRIAYMPSNAWTNEAIALIDDMARQGGAAEGYAAAKQLMKSHSSLPGHFYTRVAILGALNKADSAEVLGYLELAKINQADPNGNDLPGGSIRSFVATIPSGSMDKLLNSIASQALSKETDRKPELKVLASLLVMDGQSDRASRFANAIDAPVNNEPSAPTSGLDIQSLALAK